MKLFECIVDDGESVFKTTVPAKNKKELLSVWGGNGSFEKIKDVTSDYPISISSLRDAISSKFGKEETELIISLVEQHNNIIR